MTVSTLPKWVILSVVGLIILMIIPYVNYYVSPIGKLRAKCLSNKDVKQRNNSFIEIKRRINSDYYPLMALIFYVIVSVCFCIENYKMLVDGGFLFLRIVIFVLVWFVVMLVVIAFLVGLMEVLEERSLGDLKSYYERRYNVMALYSDKVDIESYYEQKSSEK